MLLMILSLSYETFFQDKKMSINLYTILELTKIYKLQFSPITFIYKVQILYFKQAIIEKLKRCFFFLFCLLLFFYVLLLWLMVFVLLVANIL